MAGTVATEYVGRGLKVQGLLLGDGTASDAYMLLGLEELAVALSRDEVAQELRNSSFLVGVVVGLIHGVAIFGEDADDDRAVVPVRAISMVGDAGKVLKSTKGFQTAVVE